MGSFDAPPTSRSRGPCAILVGALVLASAGATPAKADDTVRVAASGRYQAGRVHRFVLGGGYRDLWQTPIELPLLDLAKEGGGLTPTKRFGGLQTAVLGFKAANGRIYSFRGTDKDPSAILDPVLRDTVFRAMVQDQMAAQHPGGPLAAAVIADAAGVPAIPERMVVMPDDPALGEFREEFAGMVGNFYEYPLPAKGDRAGFLGATEIIDHEKLYAQLSQPEPDQVDVQAFLRARLVDLLLGDFDRHRKQWRWARRPGETKWWPIPEDRDQAFVRYDGAGQRLGSVFVPILQNYGPTYPSMRGLALHGWEQDRWLLPALGWPRWVEAVDELQRRIDDEAIDAAIAALPPEYAALDGERMRRDVRGRRDQLRDAARRFYEHLAAQVDIQGSAAAEDVHIQRTPDGKLTVTVQTRSSTTGPSLSREFLPNETHDLRIYLRGGDDRVMIEGPPGKITLRVIAEDGAKTIEDAAGGTRIYDPGQAAQITRGPGTDVDRDPYTPPPSDSGFVDVEGVPPRDWGSETLPTPLIGYERDMGLLLGGGGVHTRFGFRQHPWSSQHKLIVGWATGANRPNAAYFGRFRPENSGLEWRTELSMSGIEIMRFYGFGNETSAEGDDGDFRVRNQRFRAAPSLYVTFLQDRLRLEAGPWVEYSRTKDGDRLIDRLAPYGAGDFGSVGALVNVQLDLRETLDDLNPDLVLPMHLNPAAGYPTSGFLVDLTGRVSPPVWDVDEVWGSLTGSVSGYLSLGARGRFVAGLRVGGKTTFGNVPYFEAAYLGGGNFFSGQTTVRGHRAQRFAGESAVFGNLDLRLMIATVKLLVPGDFGLTAFTDVGRVFEHEPSSGAGSESSRWHPSVGGGVWFAPLQRTNTVSLTVAHSAEETLLAYFRAGFHY